MITHYFNSIFKSFRKSKIVTTFNLLGLSISFAAFLLSAIYVYNEYTYDRYNDNYEQIYRLDLVYGNGENTKEVATLPCPMANIILKNVPEIEKLCTIDSWNGNYCLKSDFSKKFELDTREVDTSFIDVFTVKITKGTQSPFKNKNGKRIIISEKAAHRIFGDKNPIGKTILANYSEPYIIDAVFKDLPNNSSIKCEAFSTFNETRWVNDWTEWSFLHYFKVSKNADLSAINKKIFEIPTLKEMSKSHPNDNLRFKFVPLKDIHFDKVNGSGNLVFVQMLILIAILLLVMAYINYLNFSIANARKVIKSLSLRRIVGESKLNQRVMLCVESALLMLISFIIALLFCAATINLWQNILGFTIVLSNYYVLILLCLILFITLGVIVSIFSTRIITKQKPILALKGNITINGNKNTLGKVLIIIQYAISIILITGVLFINKQVKFLKNFDLGFNKENIIVVETTKSIRSQEKAFVDELLKDPNITNYAFSQFIPGNVPMGWGREVNGKRINFKCWPVDERYLDFMGFEIVEGRKFSENINADTNNFILNQQAVKDFGWDKVALGKTIPGFDFTGKVVGVIKDIKYASLHEKVQPMAFWLTKTRHYRLSLKVNGNNISQTISHIKNVYSKFEKNYSISYKFLDDSLDDLYKTEEKQEQLILIFCILSILVSIIGALGLIIFICEYRIKEIGVRKVNGATTFEILLLLNSSFIKWLIVSYVIAVPLSYYLISTWLTNFAYQTTLSWWVFALAGIITLLIALFTVTWKTLIAASKNPIESLRYE